jgi:hypothetical protein
MFLYVQFLSSFYLFLDIAKPVSKSAINTDGNF